MITIDLENATVAQQIGDAMVTYPLATPEAFELISHVWLRAGWEVKHVYSFTWFGRPVIQLPEDLVRVQELVYRVKPDVIVETGVAHGGSLVFYASLCKAMGHGRVIGVDVEIRPHNRQAIEAHELFEYITLIEGSSIDAGIVAQVHALIAPGERAMVILDSNHSRAHVLAELRAYADLVPIGSYLIACDGIMPMLAGAPRTKPDWAWNNPRAAAGEFLQENRDFARVEPAFLFNEGTVRQRVTYWQQGILQRVR